jgi:hypothetical protein
VKCAISASFSEFCNYLNEKKIFFLIISRKYHITGIYYAVSLIMAILARVHKEGGGE